MKFIEVDNIFDLYPEAIAHPINCIGLSHDLLSKKIKKVWPNYYREYARTCLRKQFIPYKAYYHSIDALFGTKSIVTLTIRNNWQERLKQDSMKEVINSLMQQCKKQNILTIAIPEIEGVPKHWLEQELKNTFQDYPITIYFFKNN
ncbi:macro domain-containing protein [Fluviispira multicolorata]|uniref:Macro domain-containing protein n=1 Tax=Fluviispira multicolorata TaxID=2654512 RepID=A0A833N5D7_9BACT|nr:macro domain-containing protein [Fluviispira multicolorata]KAB8030652.1 hypothetical protein GCL57_06670 [Fluviispira multicolorata]